MARSLLFYKCSRGRAYQVPLLPASLDGPSVAAPKLPAFLGESKKNCYRQAADGLSSARVCIELVEEGGITCLKDSRIF